MAFTRQRLGRFGLGRALTLLDYHSGTDTLRDCCAAGYFRDASPDLHDRDVIVISAPDGLMFVQVVIVDGAISVRRSRSSLPAEVQAPTPARRTPNRAPGQGPA